ncbi:hypothetical protein LSAT2_022940 [Lamellibrachia satsuma]|nr:hypothetical protein LSAT2_022940 [Lamellibrachia satsuma]
MGARNVNPIPYSTECFGHKLHMDQNEQLAMFGFIYILAVDGNSGKIVRSSGTTFSYTIMCMGRQYWHMAYGIKFGWITGQNSS